MGSIVSQFIMDGVASNSFGRLMMMTLITPHQKQYSLLLFMYLLMLEEKLTMEVDDEISSWRTLFFFGKLIL